MDKSEVIHIIRRSKAEMARRYGVERVGLFGTYVKEQQKKTSDIDILVSFAGSLILAPGF